MTLLRWDILWWVRHPGRLLNPQRSTSWRSSRGYTGRTHFGEAQCWAKSKQRRALLLHTSYYGADGKQKQSGLAALCRIGLTSPPTKILLTALGEELGSNTNCAKSPEEAAARAPSSVFVPVAFGRLPAKALLHVGRLWSHDRPIRTGIPPLELG